jgi:hypothetical protein
MGKHFQLKRGGGSVFWEITCNIILRGSYSGKLYAFQKNLDALAHPVSRRRKTRGRIITFLIKKRSGACILGNHL